jgi:hypothetical protein
MYKDKENEFFIGFINFEKEIIRTNSSLQYEYMSIEKIILLHKKISKCIRYIKKKNIKQEDVDNLNDDVWNNFYEKMNFKSEKKVEKTQREDKSYLYLIYDTFNHSIKIGKSLNPLKRLETFQISNPNKLILLAIFEKEGKNEKKYHKIFEKHKIKNEWFKACDEIFDFFKINKVNI